MSFEPPEFDFSEIIRYSKGDIKDEATVSAVKECIKESEKVFTYNVCYTVCDILRNENKITLSGVEFESKTLETALSGYEKCVIFASTVGYGIDRIIMKYSLLSPSKALIFQGIGAERVESLCDVFCEKMGLQRRVSPGYGDIPLEKQTEILHILDTNRKIGVTLTSGFLMKPTKSVTAIAGLKGKNNV